MIVQSIIEWCRWTMETIIEFQYHHSMFKKQYLGCVNKLVIDREFFFSAYYEDPWKEPMEYIWLLLECQIIFNNISQSGKRFFSVEGKGNIKADKIMDIPPYGTVSTFAVYSRKVTFFWQYIFKFVIVFLQAQKLKLRNNTIV